MGAGTVVVTAVRRYSAGKKMAAASISDAGRRTVPVTADTHNQSARPGQRWVWVIWLIQFLPLLLWVVIAVTRGSEGPAAAGDAEGFAALKYALYAIAAVLLVLVFMLRRAFRKPAAAR